MKLAIIGSRTCPPIDIEQYLKYIPDTIVSGGAKGADTYAREFAKNFRNFDFKKTSLLNYYWTLDVGRLQGHVRRFEKRTKYIEEKKSATHVGLSFEH